MPGNWRNPPFPRRGNRCGRPPPFCARSLPGLTDTPMAAHTRVDILIVGAGFSGLGMAIQLRRAGIQSFLVIEKNDDVGGTWLENRYPGCACDVPSHLYSFSFDRNPQWSRMYAPQPEIWDYLRDCARRYGIVPYIRFSTPLQEAVWDDVEGLWRVTAGDGVRIQARVLITGMGA